MDKKIKVFLCPVSNENGSAIVMALVVLVVLTILGIVASRTSTIELLIAGNDVRNKLSFYAASGGTEAGIELVEQDIYERNWPAGSTNGGVGIFTGDLCMNDSSNTPNAVPSDTNQDAVIPLGAINTGPPFSVIASVPHTNLKIVGNTALSTGSAIQLAAGYEGKGKGLAGAGAWIMYDIRSHRQDAFNSTARIYQQWRHVM